MYANTHHNAMPQFLKWLKMKKINMARIEHDFSMKWKSY